MKEEYATFSIEGIIFYDEIEKNLFLNYFLEAYKHNVLVINNKKVIGKPNSLNISKEDRKYLELLEMKVNYLEKANVVSISGYGLKSLVSLVESYIRKLFDEGRIVTYNLVDDINKGEEVEESFNSERLRREELFVDNKLEAPSYRSKVMVKDIL